MVPADETQTRSSDDDPFRLDMRLAADRFQCSRSAARGGAVRRHIISASLLASLPPCRGSQSVGFSSFHDGVRCDLLCVPGDYSAALNGAAVGADRDESVPVSSQQVDEDGSLLPRCPRTAAGVSGRRGVEAGAGGVIGAAVKVATVAAAAAARRRGAGTETRVGGQQPPAWSIREPELLDGDKVT